MSWQEVIPVLQVAIGPVVIMSTVALLLLVMTNRFGHTIDRARLIAGELRAAAGGSPELRQSLAAQLRILTQRARLVRAAITFASLSALLAALLVIVLFLTALLHLDAALAASTLFIACTVCLILALVLFLRDINVSLAALTLETEKLEKAGG